MMFILAVMGNVTYALGVLLYSVEPIFLLRKLPWLVGSIGTLLFDFTVSSENERFLVRAHELLYEVST